MTVRSLISALPLVLLATGCGARSAMPPGAPAGGAPIAAEASPPEAPAPATAYASADEAVTTTSVEAAPPPAPAAPTAEGAARPSRALAATGERRERARGTTVARASGVKAGEWDDNANYREFSRWLGTEDGVGFTHVDVRSRRFLVVEDEHGKAVPNCRVSVTDKSQHQTSLVTTASGRAILFPFAEGLSGTDLVATTHCQGERAAQRFTLDKSDGVIKLVIQHERALPQTRTVDIAFVLDTTGSMSEEIAAVKATIRAVAKRIDRDNIDVRIGLVEYRDRTDPFVTRTYAMTKDIDGFARRVSGLSADGGGDTPEDMNAGLAQAIHGLQWSSQSVARMAFLIGDAPPHLDYQTGASYAASMRDAAHQGIQLFTVAASGMDELGQVVWRQIAQYTGGTNLFVLRGGAGPQSTGAGDPKSSCGGTQTAYQSGNLDQLIVQKIRRELAALDADPMRIAGLDKDENAKPCSERLVLAD